MKEIIKVRNNIHDKEDKVEGNSKAKADENNVSNLIEERNNCCPLPNFVKVSTCSRTFLMIKDNCRKI